MWLYHSWFAYCADAYLSFLSFQLWAFTISAVKSILVLAFWKGFSDTFQISLHSDQEVLQGSGRPWERARRAYHMDPGTESGWIKSTAFVPVLGVKKILERYSRYREPCLSLLSRTALKPCYLSLVLPRRLLRRLGASDRLHLFAVPALSSHHPALISVQTSLKCFSVGFVSSALRNAPTLAVFFL